jgi:predicted transposase YdaD
MIFPIYFSANRTVLIADVLRKEGIEEGKKEKAINLYEMGLTIDQIAQGTGLDKETLKETLKDLER